MMEAGTIACVVVFFFLILLLFSGTMWSNNKTYNSCKQSFRQNNNVTSQGNVTSQPPVSNTEFFKCDGFLGEGNDVPELKSYEGRFTGLDSLEEAKNRCLGHSGCAAISSYKYDDGSRYIMYKTQSAYDGWDTNKNSWNSNYCEPNYACLNGGFWAGCTQIKDLTNDEKKNCKYALKGKDPKWETFVKHLTLNLEDCRKSPHEYGYTRKLAPLNPKP